VSLVQIDTDGFGDVNVAWVQGNDILVNWGGEGQAWQVAPLLVTTSPARSASSSTRTPWAIRFAWATTDGKVYVYRWGARPISWRRAAIADVSVTATRGRHHRFLAQRQRPVASTYNGTAWTTLRSSGQRRRRDPASGDQ